MSLDLFPRETAERMNRMTPVPVAEVGTWDGFIRGTAMHTMRGFARAGSAIDLLGSVGPIIQDAFTGGTEAQDRYFREHDEVWGSAIEFWTPKPNEVGAAAEITGTLLSTLPLVIVNPSLAVGTTQVSIAEDLVKKGVDPVTAQAVGASQAIGLGLGIYVPIFGRTLTQRILAGGVGFNVAQGIAMRATGGALLEGTPAEGEFKAFDPAQLTLDVLLGAAFGTIVHLSPTGRAQSAATWKRIEDWGKTLKPSEIDALTVLRQAQHLNVDSMPGRPTEPVDVERHAQRVKQAIEQLARDQPVEVSDLPPPRFEPDEPRLQRMEQNAKTLAGLAEDVRQAEELPLVPTESEAPAALRGATEPPPPRGQRGVEAAGAEGIPRAANLSDAERAIETRFAEQIASDLEGSIRAYEQLPESQGGKVINTDIARELSIDYAQNRAAYSGAVHEPASFLIKEIYRRRLAQPDPLGMDTVSFTAGGTGAGKSTAIGDVLEARVIYNQSQIIYDTNMNTFKSAVDKIDQALKAGKKVHIMTVIRDPVDSLVRGALPRAMRMGRTVPIKEHARTHVGAAETIPQLVEKYQGDKRVAFHFIDNTRGKGKARLTSAKLLKPRDFAKLESELRKALDREYRDGRISETVYRGTLGDVRRGAGEGPPGDVVRGEEPPGRRGGGGLDQRPDQGRAPPEVNEPLRRQAERIAAEQPHLILRVGEQADGTPIVKTVEQYLDDARAEANAARQDAALFDIAAQCLMGGK